MLVELSYVCILSLLQLLIWISYLDILPEAICCYLQTYTVNDVLLVMYCMCLPAFFVTSADKSQLWVYLCYLLIIILPEACTTVLVGIGGRQDRDRWMHVTMTMTFKP